MRRLFSHAVSLSQRGKKVQVILKILYWTVASVYLLILLTFAFGIRPYTPGDILWVCLAVLYLVGSSVLLIRSTSVLRRCAAIALLVLAPVAILTWAVFHLPIL
jgi:hypothetical protein